MLRPTEMLTLALTSVHTNIGKGPVGQSASCCHAPLPGSLTYFFLVLTVAQDSHKFTTLHPDSKCWNYRCATTSGSLAILTRAWDPHNSRTGKCLAS